MRAIAKRMKQWKYGELVGFCPTSSPFWRQIGSFDWNLSNEGCGRAALVTVRLEGGTTIRYFANFINKA
jgi:hypothetical protein